MPVAVMVDWYRPYTGLDALRDVIHAEWEGVPRALYMALARWNTYQYIGLTTNPPNRIHEGHEHLNHKDNNRFYVGEIVTQGITGPRNGRQPPDLRLAEHALPWDELIGMRNRRVRRGHGETGPPCRSLPIATYASVQIRSECRHSWQSRK